MNNKMEPVTPVVVIQGAMVFALLAGFAFGLFTGQAHVAGLSMAWLSVCGWFFTGGYRDWETIQCSLPAH